MILFLDTEWADVIASELVSLSLVSEDGNHRFYAELDPLPTSPTDFVRSVVYPLLDRGEFALSEAEFTRRLRAFFLEIGQNCTVLFDCAMDGGFLRHALEGFEQIDVPEMSESGIVLDVHMRQKLQLSYPALPAGTSRINIHTELLLDAQIQHFVEHYFAHRPEMARRRHHAAVDAEALRRGYLATRLGIPLEGSA